MSQLVAALVQLCSSDTVAANIEAADMLVREAAAGGAELIMTPEMSNLVETRSAILFEKIKSQERDPMLARMQALARELGCWIHIGSLAIKIGERRAANRSFLIDSEGEIRTTYDKLHMFDVDLPGGESYRESKQYQPGSRAVVADTPWGKLGLTICYDLRFPYLYRRLADDGARMIAVPAAFTRLTGEAHWHILLRARAIENTAFVLAAAQTGRHSGGRETYGHSLAINPWGEILADGGTEIGATLVELDLKEVDKARGKIPSLQHTRSF